MMNAGTRTHCKPVTPFGGPARRNLMTPTSVMTEGCALTVTIEISPGCSSCCKADCGLFGQDIVCPMLNTVTFYDRAS
jgi:hypothetical protein